MLAGGWGGWEDQGMQWDDCKEDSSCEIAAGEMKAGSGWQKCWVCLDPDAIELAHSPPKHKRS